VKVHARREKRMRMKRRRRYSQASMTADPTAVPSTRPSSSAAFFESPFPTGNPAVITKPSFPSPCKLPSPFPSTEPALDELAESDLLKEAVGIPAGRVGGGVGGDVGEFADKGVRRAGGGGGSPERDWVRVRKDGRQKNKEMKDLKKQ
jgi:hypothetical protein